MAEATTSAASRRKSGGTFRQNFITECRDSRVIKSVELSPNSRWILKRHLDGLSRSAYLMRFYCRIGMGPEAEEQISESIKAGITAASEDIAKRIAAADAMLAKEKIDYKVGNFEAVKVAIIDPLAFHFLKVLEQANELEQKINILWLATSLDSAQKKGALREIETTLKNVHKQSRELFLGLRSRHFELRDGRQAAREKLEAEAKEPESATMAASTAEPKSGSVGTAAAESAESAAEAA